MISTGTDWRSKAASNLPAILPSRGNAPVATVDAPLELVKEPPTTIRARMSGVAEPINLSTQMDAERIQNALRTAERGETWQLFTIYRDMRLGYSHLKAEWNKRKMVVVGQPHSLIPASDSSDDVTAAKVIQQMIAHCENWMDALTHILDATLYPVSVVEKIFQPVEIYDEPEIPIRYWLKRLEPVNYILLCFKWPYTTAGMMPMYNEPGGPTTRYTADQYTKDAWESDLRIYSTYQNGTVDWTVQNAYAPDPMRHVVYRGDMNSRSIRDNYGGDMRAILFWWLLATKDRDWFGQYMQKYGSPFLVAKADSGNSEVMDNLRKAFALAVQIGGIVIPRQAEVELEQAAATDGANAHKVTIDVCNSEVSKIILGQVLSSTPKNTGLGSGVADLHGEVREDIRQFDTMKLNETLKTQLFEPYLRINGYRGRVPDMSWGGLRESALMTLGKGLNEFAAAGIEPDDDGIEVIGRRVGFGLRRKPLPQPAPTPQNA